MDPRFSILDVVEIRSAGVPRLVEFDGGRGVVIQTRRYGDGRYRYSVAPLDGAFDVAMILDDQHLGAVGESAAIDVYALPGPFSLRDCVRVSASSAATQVAGRVGIVAGADERGGPIMVAVWFEDLGEIVVIDAEQLVATGDRMPAPAAGRLGASTRVSQQGAVLGQEEYVVVDELERHL